MTSERESSIRADVLARLLLVQSTAAHLPDETAILAFTCRGIEAVPGVGRAFTHPGPAPSSAHSLETQQFELRFAGTDFGHVVLRLSNAEAFAPYAPHVQNLLFVIALILEERRQRRLTEEYQRQLEMRILERTRQLSEEKERLQVTLNSIGDGVIATDPSGSIVEMNPVAQELTGWSLAEAYGRPLGEVFVVIDERPARSSLSPLASALAANPLEHPNTTQLVTRTGKRYAVSTSRAAIRDRDGHPLGTVLVFHDMTERLRLIEQTQRAERLDAIGILAGGIAHDFNNLLSGMFGYLGLARELATDNEEQVNALDEAARVFERARELTRQLLTFSKGGSPVRSAIDLRKLLTDCSRFALSGSNVSLNLRIVPNLTSVAADSNQIWRVIDNLIRNAVQAMPQGGMISLDADLVELDGLRHPTLAAGQYAKISVKDNGPGIPAEILPRVFDPFFTTKEHGSGLGLATAYSVVRKHDGHIEVSSTPGEGTKFDIYLPVAAPVAPSLPPKDTLGHRGAGTALVLDDEPYLCTLFSRYLTRMGYRVLAVQSGEEALAAIDRSIGDGEPIRVALLDLTIPGGIGGKEVIARVRSRLPALVAIAASGYSEDPVMANPQEFHFTASLGKPFSIAELATVLNAFVE